VPCVVLPLRDKMREIRCRNPRKGVQNGRCCLLHGDLVQVGSLHFPPCKAFDLAGGESNGAISLGAGFAANGRCRDVGVAVGGAHVGDAVIFSINGSVPQGIMLYGVGVPTNGTVTLKVCNLSGGAMAAISNLPVAVVTISI